MSQRLHVVSVCRSLPTPTDPSAGIFVLNRLAAVARHVDLQVIQPIPYCPLLRPLPAWTGATSRQEGGLLIEHAPMFYVPGALKSWDADWLSRAILPKILQVHRERPIDLIDAHFGYPDGVACVEVARRLGIPSSITIRGFEQEFADRPRVGDRMLSAFRAATGIVAVSDSLRDFAIGRGIEPDKIQVIRNAIDTQVFRFIDRATARRVVGLAVEQPLIVSVGHLISRKRHHVLIDAFARVKQRIPAARLVIIGGGSDEPSYPNKLRALVTERNLERSVTFAGNLPPGEVASWLGAADVFGLATVREGCCNAVLEALAVGSPVVTTPAGDNSTFVKPGENGFLAEIDDTRGLADKLITALEREDWDRLAIAKTLRQQAGDWSDVAERVVEYFEKCLKR